MSVLTGDLGSPVRETRHVSGFSKVVLDGIGHVHVKRADVESVTIEAPELLIEHIDAFVDEGELHLGFHRGISLHQVGRLEIQFEVSATRLAGVEINGAGSIDADRVDGETGSAGIDGTGRIAVSVLDAENVSLSIDGAGKIELDRASARTCRVEIDGSGRIDVKQLETQELDLLIDGAGKIFSDRLTCRRLSVRLDGVGKIAAEGSAEDVRIDVNGAGKVELLDLEAQRASVDIDGTGKVDLAVAQTLEVRIAGFGRVGYRGKPSLDVQRSGFGKVVALDEG